MACSGRGQIPLVHLSLVCGERGQYFVTLERPRNGYVAILGEGMFTREFKMPCYFSTTVHILGSTPSASLLSSTDIRP